MQGLKRLALRAPNLITAGAFCLAGLVSAVIIHELESEHIRVDKAGASALIHSQANLLHTTLNQSTFANYAMAALIELNRGEIIEFEKTADFLLESYPAISHLTLSPDGIITHVHPLQGNEASIGFNQLADESQRAEAELARVSAKMTLAGPLELVQGGTGLVARLPVFLDQPDGESVFWGFTNVTLHLQELLDAAGLEQLHHSGYEYRLWRSPPQGTARDIIAQSSRQRFTEPVQAFIEIPNGYWVLDAEPAGGWSDTTHLARNLLLGLLFTVLGTVQTWLLLKLYSHRHSLEGIVQKRTADILETQSQLLATLNAIPDLLFEVDIDGRILDYHSPRTELLAVPASALLKRRLIDLLSPEAANTCMEAIREASEQHYSYGKSYPLELNGKTHWFELSVTCMETEESPHHFIMLARDITDRMEDEDKINRLAFYDPLTQLPNRHLLVDRIEHALSNSQRGQYLSALLLIDLDNFKYLNDSLGFKMGDLLLQQTAGRLQRVLRENDTLARPGGDEFIVLAEGLGTHPSQAAKRAEQIAEKIAAAFNEPFQLQEHLYYSTASIGITLFENHHASTDELLKQVDQAMYQAKTAGRNQICFYDPSLQNEILERINLINALREAIDKEQLQLVYQPQTDAQCRVVGAEALIRWHHPDRGTISPGLFIPLAEETGQILAIGEWVLRTACLQLARWHTTEQGRGLIVSVNVSARQFSQPGFVEQVQQLLDDTGASAQHLQIELTESTLVANTQEVISKMQQLKACGILISLDDFGTGYSSLAYLRQLPIDQLKIDQSFVSNITSAGHDATLATAIISLGHSLGLEVIAEGVETEAQMAFLTEQGCDLFQGYLLGRPAAAEQIFQQQIGSADETSPTSANLTP